VSGSKLCWRDGGILAKSDDIWLSGRHVADMLATFSAKMIKRGQNILMESHSQMPLLFDIAASSILVDQLDTAGALT
jgi:hypothetical protein